MFTNDDLKVYEPDPVWRDKIKQNRDDADSINRDYPGDLPILNKVDFDGNELADDPFDEAILEAQQAIMRIRSGQEPFVDLAPQVSHIRKQQHRVARRAQLTSRSFGDEPKRRVRIFGETA